jgi:hypothetical protein
MGKRGGGTVMVATQSRFHRDMLDGEQIALKPLWFYLVPNLQVVTLACGSGRIQSTNHVTGC